MSRQPENEHPFPSTRWAFKRVRVGRPPEATGTVRAQRAHRYALPKRDPRVPLTVTVKYRGGPECWYEIQARGTVWRFPGWVSLHDAMEQVNRLAL